MPKYKVINPRTVVSHPVGRGASRNIVSIAAPAADPMLLEMRSMISRSASARPNNMPATAIAMRSAGTIENHVERERGAESRSVVPVERFQSEAHRNRETGSFRCARDHPRARCTRSLRPERESPSAGDSDGRNNHQSATAEPYTPMIP